MNYGHGGNIEEISRKYNIAPESIVDFSANINPYGINKNVKKSMIKAIDNIERYPDITYYKLKNKIAEYEGVKSNEVLLGNGAAEVIFNIVRGLNPKNALLLAPTFSEYEDALKSVKCNVNYYLLNNSLSLDEGFLGELNKDIDIIFLCNPNNPTGLLINNNLMEKVLEKTNENNITVVVDESFMDFVDIKEQFSTIKFINKYKNLIVVKSLTKFFAYPGIRVGYGLTANSEVIESINNISVPWSINTVAVEGAIVSLDEIDYMKATVQYVKEENNFLFSSLIKFNQLKVIKGSVNFILFKCLIDINLKEELIKQGVLIRSCSNYIGLNDSYYRVAVRTRDENTKLIKALELVLK